MSALKCLLLALAITLVSAKTVEFKAILNDQTRIVNGFNATVGQFPHQVSLRSYSTGSHFCGASIIGSRWILTAAHCVKRRTADSFFAVVGALELAQGGTVHNISINKPHPDYVAGQFGDDIALLKTAEEIQFSDFVKPIALPTENTLPKIPVELSGWGKTDPIQNTLPNILQFMNSTTIGPVECKKRLPDVGYHNFEKLVCHRPNRAAGACFGDSGRTSLISFEA